MQSLVSTIQMLIACGTILLVAFGILLSLPDSKLRAFLLPIVGWTVAIFCAVFVISPVDIVPEILLGPAGLVDDLAATVTGIAAARVAMKAKES